MVGNPKGRRTLGRNRSRWKNNIEIDLQEIVSEGMTVINLAQVRHKRLALLNTVMKFRFP
jgi:hypothetical protein